MLAHVTTTTPDRQLPGDLAPVPLRHWVRWAAVGVVLSLVALFVVGLEQGAVSLLQGELLHEFLHDARHLLGFPCH
jgi:hypothetical protein